MPDDLQRIRDWGISSDPDAPVLVACMNCTAMIEVRTGCRGIDDALSQGWTLDGAGDLNCPSCSEARAEIVGDEWSEEDLDGTDGCLDFDNSLSQELIDNA